MTDLLAILVIILAIYLSVALPYELKLCPREKHHGWNCHRFSPAYGYVCDVCGRRKTWLGEVIMSMK